MDTAVQARHWPKVADFGAATGVIGRNAWAEGNRMAKPLRDARLQSREARKVLPARKEPYWMELRRGLRVGYYKGSTGGTWVLREYRNGKRPKRRLGLADDTVPADGERVFSWAQVLTAALGEDRPTRQPRTDFTVAQALEEYWRYRLAKSPALSVAIDQAKIRAHVGKKLLTRPVVLLTTGELERWRNGLVETTPNLDRQRRAKSTADRVARVLFAALTYAYRTRHEDVPSADAWRAVQPFRNVDLPRTRFLSVEQLKRLLGALPAGFRDLARGALYSGLRLGELLALKAGDLVEEQLHVRPGKSGRGRTVPLSADGVAFFMRITEGKAPDAWLFRREDGSAWQRIHASRYMARACKAAAIDPPATFHDLRRTYASLLLNRGAEAEVIQELLGHADLRMTRRTYAHLLNRRVRSIVAKKLPSFGLEEDDKRRNRS